MKILIAVLSLNDNGGTYSKFYKAQKETWDSVKVDGVDTYYYFGNHVINEIKDDKILVDVPESTIRVCGYKTIKAFDLIKNYDFDILFRTNSSSYVDKKLLYEYIKKYKATNHYSGVNGNHNGITFASGSGYFISKDLIHLVLKNSNLWNHRLIDDVAIAELLSKFNVSPMKNPRFDVYNNNIPDDFFHYRLKTNDRNVDIKNMYNIFNIKNGKNREKI